MTSSAESTHATPASPLTKGDIRTMGLAALGGALEFYDFIIYVFFAAAISQLFFPADMPAWLATVQTFGIFAAGYLARPLGGVIIAHFGDILGRKRMFMVSILLMTLPTLFIGIMPTYATIGLAAPLLLLVMRICQGAAVGGEIPGAWVFVAEHVPKRHVALACGILTAGLTFGILLGSVTATIINHIFTETEVIEFAWRIPFIIGGIFGIVAVYLRRFLQETPVFQEIHANAAIAEELPIKTVITSHKRAVVISMLFTWFISAAIVVMILMTPTLFQNQLNIPAQDMLPANVLATLTLSVSAIFFGWLSDRFPAPVIIILGSLGLGITSVMLYTHVGNNPHLLYPLYILCGFFVGTVGAIPGLITTAFPAKVRFSGLSFSYNMSYAVFGATTPVLVTYFLSEEKVHAFFGKISPALASFFASNITSFPAYYMVFVCIIAILTALYLLLSKKVLNTM